MLTQEDAALHRHAPLPAGLVRHARESCSLNSSQASLSTTLGRRRRAGPAVADGAVVGRLPERRQSRAAVGRGASAARLDAARHERVAPRRPARGRRPRQGQARRRLLRGALPCAVELFPIPSLGQQPTRWMGTTDAQMHVSLSSAGIRPSLLCAAAVELDHAAHCKMRM